MLGVKRRMQEYLLLEIGSTEEEGYRPSSSSAASQQKKKYW